MALELAHPFTAYVFVERSSRRVAQLVKLQSEYSETRRIIVRHGDCNPYLREKVADNPKIDWTRNWAIVFLDPLGMQVGWETIETLAETKAIEIFLNFPVGMAIQRLLNRQPDEFTHVEQRKLDEYFGSPEWFDVLYRPTKSLFGDQIDEKMERSGLALLRWYRRRLRGIFSEVSKAALIRNTQGGHLYYLLLASHNRTGVKIADHILAAGEAV